MASKYYAPVTVHPGSSRRPMTIAKRLELLQEETVGSKPNVHFGEICKIQTFSELTNECP